MGRLRRAWTNLRLRFSALARPERWERDLDDEIAFHIEQETAENVRRGFSPAEARRKALVDFGGIERVKARHREVRGYRPLTELAQDVGYALRGLRRRPGFAAIVLSTLALGVGANAAVFSLVDHVLFRALPFPDSQQLVRIHGANQAQNEPALGTSWADFVDIRSTVSGLDGAFVYRSPFQRTVTEAGRPATNLMGADLGWSALEVLGVGPRMGRPFTEEEHRTEARVTLISEALWSSRFGSDPGIVGRSMRISGEPHQIVGVMPASFDFPEGTDLWIPFAEREITDADNASQDGFGRDWRNLNVVGRRGVARSEAELDRELAQLAGRLQQAYPGTNANHEFWSLSMHENTVGSLRTPLLLLLSFVGLVLMIACVNVANLLLARGSARTTELAVRTAHGAARGRIIRQLLTESTLYAVLGGAAGLILGSVVLAVLVPLTPVQIPRLDTVTLDLRIVAVTLSVVTIAGVIFGLLPALWNSKTDLRGALGGGSAKNLQMPFRTSAQHALIVAEVALATVLVVAAGLTYRSVAHVTDVDPGFDPQGVLSVRIAVQPPKYTPWEGYRDYFTRTIAAAREIPGIESAALSFNNPMEPGGSFDVDFTVEGVLEQEPGRRPRAAINPVTPGYFQTVSIPFINGRDFTIDDAKGAPGVAIVNEAFARRYFQGRDPIGFTLQKPQFWGDDYPVDHEIVGVVADVRSDGLVADPHPTIFFPYQQAPFGNMRLLLKTSAEPTAYVDALRDAVWSVDNEIPLDDVTTLHGTLASATSVSRFGLGLIGSFAMLALILAAVGLYGVMAFAIARQTKEIGLRKALGAEPTGIVARVVGRALMLWAAGAVIGIGAAVAGGVYLSGALYGVDPWDPGTITGVVLTMGAVCVLSAMLPASRAASIHPIAALKED